MFQLRTVSTANIKRMCQKNQKEISANNTYKRRTINPVRTSLYLRPGGQQLMQKDWPQAWPPWRPGCPRRQYPRYPRCDWRRDRRCRCRRRRDWRRPAMRWRAAAANPLQGGPHPAVSRRGDRAWRGSGSGDCGGSVGSSGGKQCVKLT